MNVDWLLLVLRLLAVAVLYVFLAITVYVIWLDLRSGAEDRRGLSLPDESDPAVPVPKAHLVIAAPLNPTDGSSHEFHLAPRTSIGRAEDNDILLVDDCVSSHHAEVVFRDGHWWLQDLASRNGTLLNGEVIEGAVVLRHGDVIGVGNVALNLDLNPDAQSQNEERRLEWNQSDWQ